MMFFGRLCTALLIGVTLAAGSSGASAQGFNIFQPRQAAPAPQQQQQQRPAAKPPAAAPRSGGLFPAPPPARGAAQQPARRQPAQQRQQAVRPASPSPFGQQQPPPQQAARPGFFGQPARPAAAPQAPTPQPASAPPPNRFRLFDFFGGNNTGTSTARQSERPSGWPFGGGGVDMRPRQNVPLQPQVPPPVQARPAPRPVKPAVEVTTWVYVLGDSVADNLAAGLSDALDDKPEVAVRRRIRAGSGLIDEGDESWPKIAAEVAALDKLNYVVVEVGTRDNRPFMDGDREIALLSDEWKQRYAARVDAVLEPFKAKGTKAFWVGVPPMRDEELSADLVAINDIIKERVSLAGQTYIDVWEGFVNESDAYSQSGPDLDGQEVRLRLNDGVHFTRAGSRKLAHYVERDLRREIDGSTGGPGQLPLDIPSAGTDDGSPAGPLIVLTAPAMATNGQLVGEGTAHNKPVDEIERVLVRGEAPTPVAGRLDDAEWYAPGTQPSVRLAGESFGPPPNPHGPVVAGASPTPAAYTTATPSEQTQRTGATAPAPQDPAPLSQ